MNVRLMASVFLAGAMACGTAFAQSSGDKKQGGEGKSVQVPIKAQNNSGENGTIKLTPMGDKTKVEISLRGAPKAAQPAHVHEGTCAQMDPKPKYPLSNVVNGKSSSEVPVSIDKLTDGSLAINVHKSGNDLKTYVACGDLKSSQG
jgi:Cu/Zn superoxide dismutase